MEGSIKEICETELRHSGSIVTKCIVTKDCIIAARVIQGRLTRMKGPLGIQSISLEIKDYEKETVAQRVTCGASACNETYKTRQGEESDW